jgi:hypothetical protein
MAVISLVIEAIGIAAFAFLESRNSPVRWSCTRNAAERSFGIGAEGIEPAWRPDTGEMKKSPRKDSKTLKAIQNLILTFWSAGISYLPLTDGIAIDIEIPKAPVDVIA